MLTMGRLLLLCLCLSLAAPALAQWKVFSESRTVKAKNKNFVCKYQVRYKGSVTVDAKRSKVTCKPDSKGKFGTVSQTFVIGRKSVEVVHDVKKGKDTIKKINIAALTTTAAPTTTTPAPTTTTTSPMPAPSPSPTGTGTGSGTGTGTGGEEMSCSCKLPLLDHSSESGRKLNNVASRLMERKKLITQYTRGHQAASHYSSVQVLVLASLAALAAYGKVSLVQSLGTILGRSLEIDVAEQEEAQQRILSILTQASDRQLGGLLGGLGGLLGGGAPEIPNANEQVEGLVEQAIQEQINEFLTGGGIESLLTSLLESEDMGQMLGEMVNNLIENMDTEAMISSLSQQLGYELGQIVSTLDQALAGADMGALLGSIMGEMPEGQMESLLEGVNLNTMEMMMNCQCQKKN